MATFTKRVLAGVDDGHLAGGWDNTPTTLRVGRNFIGGSVTGAVRFNAVTVPQGATISSAKITLRADANDSDTPNLKVYGIDEDDTANFSADPTGRSKTTANADWDFGSGITGGADYDSPDLTSIVQEIVDRAGWASGNDMGFLIEDDGSTNDEILDFESYEGDSANCALLTIVYVGESPSPSVTPSSSPSVSVSASPSRSLSTSVSPSPSPIDQFYGLKVAKEGINVLQTQEAYDFIFNSDYGTLKYFDKIASQVVIDGSIGDFAGKTVVNHNLGYYPFAEVYVKVSVAGSPVTGNYEYVPFFGSGATVEYSANFKITQNTIELYGEFNGVSSSEWVFDFIIFLHKNNLNL